MINSNVTDIFTYEQAVFSKLQDYNQAYMTYSLCNSNDDTIKQNVLSKNICGVNGTNTISAPDASELNTSIQNLQTAINTYKTNSTPKTNAQYDASMVELTARYQKVLELRGDIDTKLQSLISTDDPTSIPAMMGQTTDGIIYANLLWTILATSLVYVIFTKL